MRPSQEAEGRRTILGCVHPEQHRMQTVPCGPDVDDRVVEDEDRDLRTGWMIRPSVEGNTSTSQAIERESRTWTVL